MTVKDKLSSESEHVEYSKDMAIDDAVKAEIQKSSTVDLEQQYHVSRKTYLVLLIMGLTWGTCTLANVGPSTTYSYAVAQLGGNSISSWIPNAGLFPLIGLQPLWVSNSLLTIESTRPQLTWETGRARRPFWQEMVHRCWWCFWCLWRHSCCQSTEYRDGYWWSGVEWRRVIVVCMAQSSPLAPS